MEKDISLPKLMEGTMPNLFPSDVKYLDMPTIHEESWDTFTEPVVESSFPPLINFVKGRDLKCVQSENFSHTGDNFAVEHLKTAVKQNTDNTFLCQNLPAKHSVSSAEEYTLLSNDRNISSKAEKLKTKGNMNNKRVAISQPEAFVAPFNSVSPVVISDNSSTDIKYLLNQLNNSDSKLSKRLSASYPKYLPDKNPVAIRSCDGKDTPCPFIEDCPTHKSKSNEHSNEGKIPDVLRCEIKTNQLPPVNELADHRFLSINVKDLEVDILNLHVKRIMELHPWMRYEETSHSFSCQDCSYEVGDSSCEMGIVKVIHCVKEVRLKAFYDLCKEHSDSSFHCVSVILKKNPRTFKAIKFLLMNNLQNFLSFDELINDIIFLFKENGNPEFKGAIINLIELVRLLNEKYMLFVVRQLNLPVSFILDFCKGIGIMRFVLPTGEPIEYALGLGKYHVKSMYFFFKAVNISVFNIIYFKVLDTCGCCSKCNFTTVKQVGSPLPIRFPSFRELLMLIERDKCMGNIFKFSKGIFQLYKEFPQKFSEIEGSYVLQNYQTCLWPALEFSFKERDKLKELCRDIFSKYGNVIALGLLNYPLPLVGVNEKGIGEIKSTYVQVRNLTKRCEEDSNIIQKLPLMFQSLSNKVSNCRDIDESVKCNLLNFVLENSRDIYSGGRKFVSDFEFLTYPSSLMALNSCPKSIENFKKIYPLAKPFLKEEPQKVLEDLQAFGKFLYKTFDSYYMPLNDILKVFSTHALSKQNFPLSYVFYCVIGTLPFFPAYVERSIYYTWNVCLGFTEKFGKGVGFNLAMIYFQQEDLPLLKSNLTVYCLQSLLKNCKGPPK